MSKEKADYKKAEEKAKELLDKYEMTKPVIDIFSIAKNEGLALKFVNFSPKYKDVAGFLDRGESTIYINNDDATNRQTFTIAHELGHFLLHQGETEILLRWTKLNGKYVPIEQEANCFAAELLVPIEMLKEKMNELSLTKKDSELLSDIFGVSESVMRYRMNKI